MDGIWMRVYGLISLTKTWVLMLRRRSGRGVKNIVNDVGTYDVL